MKSLKKIKIALIFVFSCTTLISSSQYIAQESWAYNEDATAVVFSNHVNLRAEPNLNSTIITKLNMGQIVEVIDSSTISDTINGVSSHWIKIKTGHFKGYLWGPLVTKNAIKSKANANVMFLLQEINDKSNLKLKVIKGELLLAETEFEGLSLSQNRNQFYSRGKMGLSNVQDLIYLHFVEYSCGASSGDMIFAWDGSNLNNFITQMDSDNGDYFTSQRIVLPSDLKGEKNLIHFYDQSGEYIIDEATGDYKILIKDKAHIIYQWNGTELVSLN